MDPDKKGVPNAERRQIKRRTAPDIALIPVDIDGAFALLIDISEDGAGLQTIAPLGEASSAKMTWTFPGEDKETTVTVEIIWKDDNQAGVRFKDVPEKTRSQIRRWLERSAVTAVDPETQKSEVHRSDHSGADLLTHGAGRNAAAFKPAPYPCQPGDDSRSTPPNGNSRAAKLEEPGAPPIISDRTSESQPGPSVPHSVLFQPRKALTRRTPPKFETEDHEMASPEVDNDIPESASLQLERLVALSRNLQVGADTDLMLQNPGGAKGDDDSLEEKISNLRRRSGEIGAESQLELRKPQLPVHVRTNTRRWMIVSATAVVLMVILTGTVLHLRSSRRARQTRYPTNSETAQKPASEQPLNQPEHPADARLDPLTINVYAPGKSPHTKSGADVSAAGAEDSPPVLVYQFPPQYPTSAAKAGISGKVVLKLTIGADGSVQRITPVSGPEVLIPTAVSAVRQWRYRPKVINGAPVSAEVEVALSFSNSD